jgi:uncharacterized membrane protein YeaQ/YmgE (transglycosylase-associated protein family)
MSLFALIFLGAFIGWIVAATFERDEGMFNSMLLGIVGAIIGGVIATFVTSSGHQLLMLQWNAIFWAAIGAVVLSLLVNTARKPRHTHSK